jgi:hypothetical protein
MPAAPVIKICTISSGYLWAGSRPVTSSSIPAKALVFDKRNSLANKLSAIGRGPSILP